MESGIPIDWTYRQLAKTIDHSLLQPTLTLDDLNAGCQVALDYDVSSVCILPYYVKRCAEHLAGSTVISSTTIGFPHGGHHTAAKCSEARQAIDDGARELDMVVNISLVRSGRWEEVRRDIAAVADVAHQAGCKVKVIFENCYLDAQQKIRLCEISGELAADWVKTSTGYGSSGATIADVRLMRQHSSPQVQVKAAGGVRDLDTLLEYRAAGATRVGASRTQQILDEARRRLGAV